jgi:hypothetical protein
MHMGRALGTLDDYELAAVRRMSDGMFLNGPGPCERVGRAPAGDRRSAAIEEERRCLLIRRAKEALEGKWEAE